MKPTTKAPPPKSVVVKDAMCVPGAPPFKTGPDARGRGEKPNNTSYAKGK